MERLEAAAVKLSYYFSAQAAEPDLMNSDKSKASGSPTAESYYQILRISLGYNDSEVWDMGLSLARFRIACFQEGEGVVKFTSEEANSKVEAAKKRQLNGDLKELFRGSKS